MIIFGIVTFVLPCPFWYKLRLKQDKWHRIKCKTNFAFKFFRFPFSWQNPFGYPIAFTLQYIMLMYVFEFIALAVSMVFGIYLLTTSMFKDMKQILRTLNKFPQNELMFILQLNDFLNFHSISKQLRFILMSVFSGDLLDCVVQVLNAKVSTFAQLA